MSNELQALKEIAFSVKQTSKNTDELINIRSEIEQLGSKLDNIQKSIDDLVEKLSD